MRVRTLDLRTQLIQSRVQPIQTVPQIGKLMSKRKGRIDMLSNNKA